MDREEMLRKLKELRIDAGVTQKVAASTLEWSPSKILRIEYGQVNLRVPDLNRMLALYGVTDQALIKALVDTARAALAAKNKRGQTRRPQRLRPNPTWSQAALMHVTSRYVDDVLTAVTTINASIREDDRDAAAKAADTLINSARALRHYLLKEKPATSEPQEGGQ